MDLVRYDNPCRRLHRKLSWAEDWECFRAVNNERHQQAIAKIEADHQARRRQLEQEFHLVLACLVLTPLMILVFIAVIAMATL